MRLKYNDLDEFRLFAGADVQAINRDRVAAAFGQPAGGTVKRAVDAKIASSDRVSVAGDGRHHARRAYSVLCQREFASGEEKGRGEELELMRRAGAITDLEYQVVFVLSEKPRVKISIDFKYKQDGVVVYEDKKGWRYTPKRHIRVPIVERDFRVKLAWLKKDFSIKVNLV